MKPISVPSIIAFLIALFTFFFSQAQNISVSASAVWMTDFSKDTVFNVTGTLGGAANIFTGNNFGAHTPNSHSLVFRGGQLTTHSTSGASDVCSARMYYRVYPQGGTTGIFSEIDFFFGEDCEFPPQFNSGGSCSLGDQKFDLYLPDGTTDPYAPVDLTTLPTGNYIIEVYYAIDGLTDCSQTVILNNGGNTYKASFTIQNLSVSSTNPTTCNGSDGSVTISGLAPTATYSVRYTDDGNYVGPINLVADGAGQVIITGLNAGIYSDFELVYNGNTTNLNNVVTLANPAVVPKFKKIDAFCSGSTPPILPATSQNGITGTWNPAIIDNQTSNSYVFTPDPGQCASEVTMNVVVNQTLIPTFSFGTTLTLCAGATPPFLYKPSDNGITGTWSPSAINNQNSGVYTFTPNPNQCANGATLTVTVKPVVTPTFSFGTSLTICAGASVPSLTTTSINGITGTWSPSTVDNQNTGTYSFTPTAGQCATTTSFNVTVDPVVTPVFNFGTSLSICTGGNVPSLPATSANGITGSWSPSTVSNQASAIYTFTPTAGACTPSVTFTVTVGASNTPTFTFGTSLSICRGGSVPSLPTTSANGITGSWGPSTVDNINSATYTFTPDAGQCAVSTNFVVTVNPILTPTFSFGTSLTICAGASVPSLANTSTNSITGSWSPSSIDNQNTATYTFTPSAGQCATSTSLTVTVNPNIIPTFSFGTTLTICAGGGVPSLPSISDNGITGTWSPSITDNQSSGTYVFTPSSGQCATTAMFSVTVNPIVTPIFSFGTSLSICAGVMAPTLPTTSSNGITGTWSPSSIDNQNSATYIFTPNAGQCATNTNLAVTVNAYVIPTFSIGSSLTICPGGTVPLLPTTSSNGITGTWNPAVVSNQASDTYTFTANSGQCTNSVTFIVSVSPNTVPTFSFGTSVVICAGGTVPVLSTTSTNGISGTWLPSIVNNQNSGTYTFTPSGGQCATTVTFVVTVNPVVPTFSFGTSMNICAGADVPSLPAISSNGIAGTWNPTSIDNQNSRVYTFTPVGGQCETATTFTVTVNPKIQPTFSFGTTLTICAGSSVPSLPTTSSNGITGTWSPAVVSNQAAGVYTFTPNSGQCAYSTNFVVTVNQNIVPTFNFGTAVAICKGGNVPTLPTTSTNGITGIWIPAVISNQTSGTYTFTPNAGACASGTSFNVTVTPIPAMDSEADITVTDGAIVSANIFTGTPAAISFHWTNSNMSIGLDASGTGNAPSFTATNPSDNAIKATITVTPAYNGCTGAAKSYVITVLPLDKDIFVANIFTPNGDGRNDILYARSNYIKTIEMRIFNQYGKQVELITDPKKGWDGKWKGTPQPVGVYMYRLKATMTDGRTTQVKGNVTLLR